MKLECGILHKDDGGGCLVCKTLTPPFHTHHVIPRASGGNDGPLAFLCNDCHEAIHDAAKKFVAASEYSNLESAKKIWKPENFPAADRLVKIIVDSENLTRGNSNKTVSMSINLTGKQNEKLMALASRLQLSKSDTLYYLIESIRV